MSGLPNAVQQSPACGACNGDTEDQGDRWVCHDCGLSFDETTLEAAFQDPDETPCGAACDNPWHKPGRIHRTMSYECRPCALPTGHVSLHWNGCTVRIGGTDE